MSRSSSYSCCRTYATASSPTCAVLCSKPHAYGHLAPCPTPFETTHAAARSALRNLSACWLQHRLLRHCAQTPSPTPPYIPLAASFTALLQRATSLVWLVEAPASAASRCEPARGSEGQLRFLAWQVLRSERRLHSHISPDLGSRTSCGDSPWATVAAATPAAIGRRVAIAATRTPAVASIW